MTPRVSTALLRTQSDQRLLELMQAGHEAAFEAIVERYRAQLHRYARRMLPEGRCEDAVQQGLMQAWRALQDGKEVRQLRPWLYAIVHNAAVNQLRQGVFDYRELLDTVEGPDDPAADIQLRAVMRQTLSAVAALPERQRDALLAVVVAGRPQAQVAEEMGLTENGLRQLLFRARSAVRAAATAVTPLPLVTWVARAHSGGMGARIGEAAAGAGAVAGGAHVLQTGTALIVAGTLAVGGATALETPHSAKADRSSAIASVGANPTARPVALHQIAKRTHATRRASPVHPAHRAPSGRAHILLAAGRGFRVATPAMISVTTPAVSAPPAASPNSGATAPAATAAPQPAATMPATPTQEPTRTSNEGPGSIQSSGSGSSPGGPGSSSGGSSYPQNSGTGSSGGSSGGSSTPTGGSTPGGSGGTSTSGSGSGSNSGSNSGSSGSGSGSDGHGGGPGPH